jgi:rod shape-determining protein MreB
MSAGAREVYLIEEPMAAAIGAGLPVKEPQGSMVIDIGGGTTEIGVISLGGLVVSKSIRVAGDKFDKSIVDYINKKYNLIIGERTAEEIKKEIGSAVKLEEEMSIQIQGKNRISGLLETITITSEDIREALKEPVKDIGEAVKEVLEDTPADLAGDIVENGIVMTGGGALLRGIDSYISDLVNLPVYVGEEPLLAVAKGTGKVLDEIELLSSINE